MKLINKYLIFLIIISILFCISAVSASDNQVDLDNTELNQDLNIQEVSEVPNEDSIQSSDDDLELDLGEEPASFNQFCQDLDNCTGEFNLNHSYKFDETDKPGQVNFNKNNFVVNGHNNILDASGSKVTFKFQFKSNPNSHIIINDLTFINFNDSPLASSGGQMTFNNVNFTNCSSKSALLNLFDYANLTLNNCNFYSNSFKNYFRTPLNIIRIYNSNFYGNDGFLSAIEVNRGQLIVENSSFENFTGREGSIINYKGDYFAIKNSKFMNSKSDLTGGAILAKYFPLYYEDEIPFIYYHSGDMLIENCTFYNLSSSSNGGAIHIDLDSGSERIVETLSVVGCNFTDCSSKFGGALSILGGCLNISDSNFINNRASFEGGAIYSSWTNAYIAGSNFTDNEGSRNAGALYFDKGKLTINGSSFIDNKAIEKSTNTANAIYAHDVSAYFVNSTFDNGEVSVYADFASDSKIENVKKNDDIFLMDNHDYIVSVESPGIKLSLTGNQINVDTLPSRFDARDWGWVSPVKRQRDNTDCWAFATISALETSLAKSTGVSYNLSENYVQKLQLKYFYSGDKRNSLTGFSYSGVGYALSWYGVLPVDGGYDPRGMIADQDPDADRIHVQDVLFIYTGMEDTVELIKRAVIKYGAVAVQQGVIEDAEVPSEGDDIAIMSHGTHFFSIIGWDDNYYQGQGGDAPHSNFAWITRDSLYGFSTYDYTTFSDIDYFAIAPQRAAIAYIFENTNDYHVNYQTDLTGLAGFDENYTCYSNEFTSKYTELIGAVGTYFNQSGIEYSFDIFVNDKKVHTQTGVSEFPGFRTIILDKYIPINAGDQFKVVFKSNAVPYQAWSRVHYVPGMSLVSADGKSWSDIALENRTVCLKVYTVRDDTKIINNKNVVVDYDGGSYFSVKVVTADGRAVGAGAVVKFTINGKTYNVATDNNGIAKIKITQLPKKYTITTKYNGASLKNTVTVKQVLTASKVTIKKKTAKKLVLKAKLKINGKLIKGKKITFKFKGKTYKVKTNKKGIAQKTLKRNVIKKLKKGKKYTVKVTYLKDTVKTTVKVK